MVTAERPSVVGIGLARGLRIMVVAGTLVAGCAGVTPPATKVPPQVASGSPVKPVEPTVAPTATSTPSPSTSPAWAFVTGQVIVAPPSAFGGNVAVADFNQDRKPDLAICGETKPEVALFTGNGDGTFQPPTPIEVGHACTFIAATDLSGDGNLDLATSDQDGSATVLLGVGNGGFGKPTTYPTRGKLEASQAWGLTSADLNGDGVPDLAVTVFEWHGDFYAPGHLAILLNKGAGRFADPIFYPDRAAVAVTAGDFDGDGRLDVATGDGDGSVRVFRGDGAGGLGQATEYTIGGPGVAILTADLNGDGHLDLATGNDASSSLGVMLGKGDGTFGTATGYPAGNTHTIATGDLDGDGHLDLVAGGYSDGFVRLLPGQGDGTFGAESRVGSGALALSVAVADLNGDGRPDIVVEDGVASVSIFLGD